MRRTAILGSDYHHLTSTDDRLNLDAYPQAYNRLSDLQKSMFIQNAADVRYFARKRDSLFIKIRNNTTIILLESAARLLFRIVLLFSLSLDWATRPIETLYVSTYLGVIYPALLGIDMLFLWG